LFFTDEGTDRDPVVFVHGWSCDSHDWSWQLPIFAVRHRVVAYDQRGHGASSVPDRGYSPVDMANDAAELLQQLGTGPAVVVGHSLGAQVASVLAVEHPELVRAVVAVDAGYGVTEEAAPMVAKGIAAMRRPGQAWATGARLFTNFYTEQSPPQLATWHRRRMLAVPDHVLVAAFEGLFEGPEQFGLRPASDEYLKRRTCPVLTIYADPAAATWEETTFTDPYSRAVGWDGSGHWLHQERPDDFNALVLDWIAGLPPTPDG
jgi:pimeloyl-ACP methyl ester carboxylesterase